ncbi:MAG: hypothetical protein IPQ00_07040 [Chloracidobacterium sp.]|nr:hypothetical protein [Chloracidobacterium sp.]
MSVIRLLENKSSIRSADDYTPLVRIYADASCLRNGAFHESAGCGAVMIDHNRLEIKLVAKYLGQVTNQQAEILACTKALEQLHRSCRVEIVSDSRYVIDTMAGRIRMRTNRLFWTHLVKACYGHHISWRWVKRSFRSSFSRSGRPAGSQFGKSLQRSVGRGSGGTVRPSFKWYRTVRHP